MFSPTRLSGAILAAALAVGSAPETSAQAPPPGGPPAPVPTLIQRDGAAGVAARGSGGEAFGRIDRWARGYARATHFVSEDVAVTVSGSTVQTLDISRNTPTVLGELVLEGVVADLDLMGETAVIGVLHLDTEQSGLAIVDLSDPAAPVQVGGLVGADPYAIAVQDSTVYASIFGPDITLRTVDLRDPTLPVPLTSVNLSATALDIVLSDTVAYLPLGVGGLGVADIRDPAAPVVTEGAVTAFVGAAGVRAAPGGAGRQVALGVRDGGQNRVRLYDAAAPALLVETGQTDPLPTFGDAQDIEWVGDRLVVPALFGGLQIVDASDPAAPVVADAVTTSKAYVASGTFRAEVLGTRVLATDVYNGAHIFDADGDALVGFHETPNFALAAERAPDGTGELYVAAGTYGLVSFRTDPEAAPGSALVPDGRAHTPDWNYASDVAVGATHVYVADGFGGVWAVSRSSMEPVSNALRNSGVRRLGLADDEGLLFATDDDGAVYVLSLADPAAPELVFSDPDGNIFDAAATGSTVWLGEFQDTDLRLADFSTPSAPTSLGDVDLSGSSVLLVREGDRLYALGNGLAVDVLDITTPTAPEVLGTAFATGSQQAMAARGDRVFLGNFGLFGLDLADPSTPVDIGRSTRFGDFVRGIAAGPDALGIAGGHAGVYLVAPPPTVAAEDLPSGAPLALRAAPNPTAGAVTLRLSLDAPAPVRLSVVDALGRAVRTLDLGAQAAGPVEAAWDGRDGSGRAVAAGVYVVRATAGERQARATVTVVR